MQIFNKTLTFGLLYFFIICYKYNKICKCVKNAHIIFALIPYIYTCNVKPPAVGNYETLTKF